MRIISGLCGGLKLLSPGDRQGVRPTEDRVKENVFNILGDQRGLRVLDAFACTGSIGLESMSRGAGFVCFIEKHGDNVRRLKENLRRTRLERETKIIQADFRKAFKALAKEGQTFDLIYLDPPFESDFYKQALDLISDLSLLAEGGRIVCESNAQLDWLDSADFILTDERRYGSTWITILTLEVS